MPRKSTKVSYHDALIDSLKIVVEGVARTFGSRCEAVLHDLRNPEKSIVKIVNGHVSGRVEGGPVTDFALKLMKKESVENLFLNYPSFSKDGRPIKSTTMLFRDEANEPLAMMCINYDLTDVKTLGTVISETFQVNNSDSDTGVKETFEPDFITTLTNSIERIILEYGKTVPSMVREDKINVVRIMDDQGLFLIKGAVKFVAQQLHVSKYTIYNYLEQVRSDKNEDPDIDSGSFK